MRMTILVCTLAVAACSGDVNAPRASLSRNHTLRYDAYTDQFRPLLSGSFDLVVHEDSTVTGNWIINWVSGVDTTTPVGPQVGSGALQGRLWPDTTVWLNLNPNYFDYNVFLVGAATVNGLAGRWDYSGFPGTLAHGRFTARYEF